MHTQKLVEEDYTVTFQKIYYIFFRNCDRILKKSHVTSVMLTVSYNQKNNGGHSNSLDLKEASRKAQSSIITERKLYLHTVSVCRIAIKVYHKFGGLSNRKC